MASLGSDAPHKHPAALGNSILGIQGFRIEFCVLDLQGLSLRDLSPGQQEAVDGDLQLDECSLWPASGEAAHLEVFPFSDASLA